MAASLIFPVFADGSRELLLSNLPLSVFFMYLLNRGTGFTQALFINCDHSLLTYSFYKQPGAILKLFRIRLREIMKINLLPALVIGCGMALLLFTSGGTDDWLNYVVILVTIPVQSMFFSVHYLVLYYLLQPYNAGTEIKSGTYQLAMWATYFFCYLLIRLEMSTLMFGIVCICALCGIQRGSLRLVYHVAPKDLPHQKLADIRNGCEGAADFGCRPPQRWPDSPGTPWRDRNPRHFSVPAGR